MSSAARVTAVGSPFATSCAKVGPESTATAKPGTSSRDLVEQLARALLDALCAEDKRYVRQGSLERG